MRAKRSFIFLCACLSSLVLFSQKIVWKPRTPLPVSHMSGEAVSCEGKLYHISGRKAGNTKSNLVYEYDPATDEWTPKSPIPTARWNIGVATVKDKIFVIGGDPFLDKNEMYDPLTDTWTTLAPLPTARQHVVAAVVDDKIYTMGGLESWSKLSVKNEMYDPQTDTWVEKAEMPTAKHNQGVSVFEGKIYIFGGATKKDNNIWHNSSSVEIYDPVSDTWEHAADMPVARFYPGIITREDHMFFLGGEKGSSVTNQMDIFYPKTNTWTKSTALPLENIFFGVSTLEEKIYVVGGTAGSPDWNMFNTVFEGRIVDSGNVTPELYQPLPDVSCMVNRAFIWTLPDFTFIDDDTLSYTAKLSSGAQLPPWLSLSPGTGTFSGNPKVEDSLEIILTARDNYLEEARDTFMISCVKVDTINITYTANAGFLIEGKSNKVLIDALFNNGYSSYQLPSELTKDAIQNNQFPFNDIDIHLVSHKHDDHFNSAYVANQMLNSENTFLLGDIATVNTLKSRSDYSHFKDRTICIQPDYDQYVDTLVNNIDLRILRLHHDNRDFSNLGFIFEVDDVKILHVGDYTGNVKSELETFQLKNENIDIALINNYCFLQGQEIMENVKSGINARHIILYHIENEKLNFVIDSFGVDPQITVFQRTLDKYRFVKKQDIVESKLINKAPSIRNVIPDASTFLGDNFNYTIPWNCFIDEDANLNYSASLNSESSGSDLPEWLTFDADGRMFSGRPDQPGVLNIKLEVKDGHGAGITAMFNITVDETNSISEKKGLEELSVFPNPASSFIRLRTSNLASFSHYSFFDVCGRQIERAPLGSELIDVSKINKGMYLLNLHSEDHIVIRKILIE